MVGTLPFVGSNCAFFPPRNERDDSLSYWIREGKHCAKPHAGGPSRHLALRANSCRQRVWHPKTTARLDSASRFRARKLKSALVATADARCERSGVLFC